MDEWTKFAGKHSRLFAVIVHTRCISVQLSLYLYNLKLISHQNLGPLYSECAWIMNLFINLNCQARSSESGHGVRNGQFLLQLITYLYAYLKFAFPNCAISQKIRGSIMWSLAAGMDMSWPRIDSGISQFVHSVTGSENRQQCKEPTSKWKVSNTPTPILFRTTHLGQ